jgi:acyl-CoA thioesterase FadM
MGHLNNATYLTYLEHAREKFFLAAGIGRQDSVVAATELEFVHPVALGTDEVLVTVTCNRVGRSSIKTTEHLSVDGTVVLNASTVSVLVSQNGRSREVPDDTRRILEAHRDVPKAEEVRA